ncbi:T9SS type A sorting domain-containing protein [Aequorivita sp. H23M31]|uniref:T9SS type A sorting domain-containing protein n=1 Tax=Aequorivita ciconiae TaxID=2494375 RepID=A0A410G0I3_9FLAO|nr:choice-of-anchor J domain-containing protein [Aequorivita sp. H23M31]QAA80755.1 T9SS type A sorting domain-containing protein [Aequorivita sp. H23M31]
MKQITLILSLFIACCSWQVSAQILNESFDSPTLPAGWTNEYVVSTENWNMVTENPFGVTPHSGTRMAEFKHTNYGAITKLVTPSLDLTGVQNPQLNFFFANIRIGVVDELRVFYKTSATGAWTQIGDTYNYENPAWTEVTLNLPEASNDYYIAFQGKFNFGGGIDLDDVSVAAGPSCLAPTNLRVKNLTTTSAHLLWTEHGSATTWNIEYGPTGFTPGNGTIITDTDGTLGETITGLSAATEYDFYVNSDCGSGDISAWAGPKQFSTTCTPIGSFPWTENFEGVETPAVPSCWTVVDHNDDARTFESDNGFGVGGSIAVGMYTDFNNGNNDDYLILPPLNLNGNQTLKFYTLLLNAGQPDEFEVVLSTTENDVEDFTNIILPRTLVNTAGPTLHTIDLSDYSGIVHIAIHIPDSNTDGYYIYFDDFSVVDNVISCPPASALEATPLADGTVEVSWTAGGSETEWILEYGAPGFVLGTGTQVPVNGTPNTVLTGLDSNTNYEIYVTAVCGVGEQSIPSQSITFRTMDTEGCGQTQVGNNFEAAYVIHPNSGYKIADDFIVSASTINFSAETVTANIVAAGGVNNVGIVFYEDNDGEPGAQMGAAIQNLSPTSQILIGAFDGIDTWEVTVELPTPRDFTRGANNEAATYWIQISATALDPASTTGIEMTSANHIGNYAVIKYQNEPWMVNPGSFDAVFSIQGSCTMVDCPQPTNLTVSNVTQTSAELSWNPTGSETEWEIEYGPAGFELGTGTVVLDNDGTIGETLTGLSPATYYEFYVTPLCGSGTPFPAGPKGFSTLCGGAIDSFPFVESFENSSGTRDCWTNEYVAGIPTDWKYVTTNGNNSVTPRTGELMAQFKIESMTEKTKLVSPAMDLTSLTSPQLTFYFANANWIGDVDELRVFYKTSAGGTWTQIGQSYTTEHTVWTQVILNLPNPSADYYIAFEGKSNFARGIDVDDVMVAEAPTCLQPNNLIAHHITQDSVELKWDLVANASNGYEWFIFESGDDPTGTPFATGTTPEATHSVTVTGLNPYTVYDFYVKSDCGNGDLSALAGPTTFKTAVVPPTCGEIFYDTGGANGNYGNNENVTTIISPEVPGDAVTVNFLTFDVDFGWDVLYIHNGPDATYPLFDSGNPATPNFPAGGYYGQSSPGSFTSTHSSGALTFVFRSDFQVTRAGWVATINCQTVGIEDQVFQGFTYYPNPVENSLALKANTEIQNVVVYNLLGQQVISLQPNNATPTLEMGNLPTGAYLMKVIIDGNENTYRLIKK